MPLNGCFAFFMTLNSVEFFLQYTSMPSVTRINGQQVMSFYFFLHLWKASEWFFFLKRMMLCHKYINLQLKAWITSVTACQKTWWNRNMTTFSCYSHELSHLHHVYLLQQDQTPHQQHFLYLQTVISATKVTHSSLSAPLLPGK